VIESKVFLWPAIIPCIQNESIDPAEVDDRLRLGGLHERLAHGQRMPCLRSSRWTNWRGTPASRAASEIDPLARDMASSR